MSKRTLGRGLGDLLGSNRGKEPASTPKPSTSPGLRILIAGAPDAANEPANEIAVPARSEASAAADRIHLHPLTRMLAIGGLASADAALLIWTANYVFSHKYTLSFWGAAGCTGSVFVAALCGTAAVSLVVFSDKK